MALWTQTGILKETDEGNAGLLLQAMKTIPNHRNMLK